MSGTFMVYGGPLDGEQVDWTAERVRVPVALALPTPTQPDTYYLPVFDEDIYVRARPPIIQGPDFYRYVGRLRRRRRDE